jgi:YesN/AraC family two-component response regulator
LFSIFFSPYYLDKISSKFAKEIENFTDLKMQPTFMRNMFEEYCRLVNKHSTRKYSKLIKEVVIYVDANLSEDIKLASVARKNGVSASSLSKTFKDETGKTFIDYVNGKKLILQNIYLKRQICRFKQ